MTPAEVLALRDLTPREYQIAEQVSLGYSSKYVAAKLHISPRTVDTHIRSIYQKLGVACRDELIELRHGVISWPFQ